MPATASATAAPPVPLSELTRVFARIGCLSFGGPAGQIALMHRELVDERQWVDEGSFLRALNLCHLLPGPEAQQLATWIGWRMHGVLGGIIGGLLFVLPGAFVMLALSLLYALAAQVSLVAAIFLGVKAAVLAIVVQAVLRVAGRALKGPFQRVLAVLSFLALFALNAPFPLVIGVAALLGIFVTRARPDWLKLHAAPTSSTTATRQPSVAGTAATILGWGALWWAPMLAIFLLLGPHHVLWDIGLFFSKLAVVTFGGAYAVLAYMAQQAVGTMGWVSAKEMADGLGLAETTPGPLIMVTQFIGFLAGWRAPAPFSPMTAGLLGAALTTWVTFLPCFLWIFAFAPWMAKLERTAWLQGALAAITAAVVGVIANLSLWFALHVLFRRLDPVALGPVHLLRPDLASFDWRAALIAAVAAALIFRWKQAMVPVLAICALLGLGLSWI
jgi:chromate transporter